jgi:hypothetical protein
VWKPSIAAAALLVGCTMCAAAHATPGAAALPPGYSVVVDESGVTTSGGLGGSGSLTGSGQGNVTYGYARECAPSQDGGPFSIGSYPPATCDQLGRPFYTSGSPEQPSGFWFTGNANCANAGRPYSGSIFTWHVQLPQSGHWHVDVYIPTWTSYGFGDQYTMTSADGQFQSGSFTQQAYHGRWVNLFGSHQFTANLDYTVQLALIDQADSTCHYQMADEMRWVYEGSAATLPVNVARPMIAGAAKEGETLAESHGSWTADPTSYHIRWEDCNTSGGSCLPIPGATGQSYTLTANDVGHTIVVEETATNSSGSGTPAISAATGVVAAATSVVTAPTTIGGSGGGGGGPGANPARVKYVFRGTRRWTKFTALTVSRVLAGGTVKASCRGRGCPRKAMHVTGRRTVSLKRFVGRRLRPGAMITIAVSVPGIETKRFTLTVRAGRSPRLS